MNAFAALIIGFFLGVAWAAYQFTPKVKVRRVPVQWGQTFALLGVCAVLGWLGWIAAGWLFGK
jgi:hypothetical protein